MLLAYSPGVHLSMSVAIQCAEFNSAKSFCTFSISTDMTIWNTLQTRRIPDVIDTKQKDCRSSISCFRLPLETWLRYGVTSCQGWTLLCGKWNIFHSTFDCDWSSIPQRLRWTHRTSSCCRRRPFRLRTISAGTLQSTTWSERSVGKHAIWRSWHIRPWKSCRVSSQLWWKSCR